MATIPRVGSIWEAEDGQRFVLVEVRGEVGKDVQLIYRSTRGPHRRCDTCQRPFKTRRGLHVHCARLKHQSPFHPDRRLTDISARYARDAAYRYALEVIP